jgi:hypothetical protein
VWAEVRKGTGEFRYILVQTRDRVRGWSIIDERKPEPTIPERQARVSSILSEHKWAFFCDNDSDVRAQSAALEEYWDKVVCLRCDRDPARCAAAGVTSLPAWSDAAATTQPPHWRGVKRLEDLEVLSQDLARGKSIWERFVGLLGF